MRHNAGFTLVEVMVALSLGAVLMLIAHQLFGGVLDTLARSRDRAHLATGEANGQRRIAMQVNSIVVDIGSPFDGRSDAVAFDTWFRGPDALPVRRRVELAADAGGLAERSSGHSESLLTGVDSLAIDYLLETGANERWARRWFSPVQPPAALRLRMRRGPRVDTLLLAVGRRG